MGFGYIAFGMAMAHKISIPDLFYRGDHRTVIEQTLDLPDSGYSPADFPFVVGALVYLGRLDEAERLFKMKRQLLKVEDLIKCRYFLGVGLCRHSFYKKSREYFLENYSSRKLVSEGESEFFIFQGLGFYHYFAGKMALALKNAEKGQTASLSANFLYGRAMTMDLKGHTLIQTGFVGQGFEALKLAQSLALKLGAEWLSDAIGVSLVSYRARFGITPHKTQKEIQTKLKSLSQQDIYSQSSLLLDLAQDHMRRGNLNEAKVTLNDCCRIVYALGNRRHAALLNMRYAYVHYLEGDSHLSLNLLRNALTQIEPRIDVLLELRLRGLEERLVADLQFEKCTKAQQVMIEKLTKKVGETVAQRILNRRSAVGISARTHGDDPFGDLLDEVKRTPEKALEHVFETGYLGLLTDILPATRGKRVLYLDLEPGSLTVFDQGSVEHYPGSVSKSTKELLLEMSKGQISKEDLIKKVWKYDYHPLRHDALIYSAIAKLRKLLGKRSHWIEVSENGYGLRTEVQVASYQSQEITEVISEAIFAKESRPERSLSLNHRQQKILRFLEQNETIDSMTVRGLFKTSEITASRDLAELLKLRLVNRMGKGRATKYSRGFIPKGETNETNQSSPHSI